jgi:outer membrane lipopolysaccharide assembly protein LptE/RlpB
MKRSCAARRARITVLATLLLAALTSCGYHLSGTGSLVPPGTTTIAVPAFINDTNEPYIDIEVTKAVIAEFIADGRLHVVDVEAADLVLRGKMVRYEAVPLSYTASTFVQQYRVRLVVSASLEDLRSKKVLWQEAGIEAVFISDYPVTYDAAGRVDITATKSVKEQAIVKASQDIALTLRSRVLEGF